MQNQEAIIAEQVRLSESLQEMEVPQRYVVHNRYLEGSEIDSSLFADKTIVRLPILPRSVEAIERIKGAASLLF